VEGGKDAQANVLVLTCWMPDKRVQSEYQVSIIAYCLLVFGAAATTLQDCLFVMDWYLNFTNDEKAQEWVKICR
jgi:hypothetical protein